MRRQIALHLLLSIVLVVVPAIGGHALAMDKTSLRVATFNASLNDDQGRLPERLREGDEGARKIAAVIQRMRPDLLLINEFDYDAEHAAADLFADRYLAVSQFGEQPISYPHRYLAPVNTGVPSGLDVNGDGKVAGPADAWGFGRHPGQYGMLVLSRFPLQQDAVRSFQLFRWSQMPGALRPMQPDSDRPFHPDTVWEQLRLSSKSHWDIPVQTPLGEVHFLVSHPTPPVFDGPENLNGLRNHDEIRLWSEYIRPTMDAWLVDDQGRCGGLPGGSAFVIAGDLNADPVDGANVLGTIDQLLEHPRTARFAAPRSAGGEQAERERALPLAQKNDPATDTASFGASSGNLRVDYVIPSAQFTVLESGVFWPSSGESGVEWMDATDHRMVWMDLVLAAP